jgi:hypothetical protein
MRLIVLGVCLFAAACSGQALNSPTSPTNASLGPAQTAARGGTDLPFRGSYTSVSEVPRIGGAPEALYTFGQPSSDPRGMRRYFAGASPRSSVTRGNPSVRDNRPR